MKLYVLPDRVDSAPDNMAIDLALLEHAAGSPDALWFRHYGWSEPAYTFGVSQEIAAVRAAAGPGVRLIRRASGGGVVSHLNDWTYTLVAPSGHALAEAKATASYHAVHAAIADAARVFGVPASLVPCPRESCASGGEVAPAPVSKPGVCFVQPEIYDVVRDDDGRKIAGAAQKRTRAGILFQGSIDRAACPEIADWALFDEALITRLAMVAEADIEAADFPVFPPARFEELKAMFACEDRNTKR